MRVVLQRVSEASVTIHNEIFASITKGLLILLGIEINDNEQDVEWLCNKIIKLRIFADENNLMNKSIIDIDGEILLISQFTLHAYTNKGNRPSFINAARPEKAIPLYEKFISVLNASQNKKIKTGVFAADMQVHLINDGPVTILIDSKIKE